MTNQVTERFRSLRRRAGHSLDALAKAAGYAGASSIQRYEDSGERGFKKRYIPRDVVDRFAPHLVGRGYPPITRAEIYSLSGEGMALGAPMDENAQGVMAVTDSDGQEDILSPQTPRNIPPTSRLPRDVKVLGTAAGGSNGGFALIDNEIDYVRRPPGIAAARDVYALYVVNDSMSPRYEPGDLIYVHPGRPAVIGDYVVVQLLDGEDEPRQALIKRLVRRTAETLYLEQFNPARVLEVSTDRVEAIHHILTANELFGV